MELIYSYVKRDYAEYYLPIDYDSYNEYEEETWYI